MEQVFDFQPFTGNWWLLQSTASTQIDEPVNLPKGSVPFCGLQQTEDNVKLFAAAVAKRFTDGGRPNVVIFSHGYSNSALAAEQRIRKAACETGKPPLNGEDQFYIGYRWPSETILSSWSGTFADAHPILLVAGLIGVLGFIAWFWPGLPLFVGFLAWGLVAFLIGYAVLRSTVYYRDSYRAVNYGALDLCEFVRRFDGELDECLPEGDCRVGLSIVGHSMGGLVVTTAIRILSDLFEKSSIRRIVSEPKPPKSASGPMERAADSAPEAVPNLPNVERIRREDLPSGNIGTSLTLLRMVLVSPDIPALALVSGRANFLGPSIRRCREAYLFSNGGDVVVGLISICANYLGVPTQAEKNSVRLADVQVLAAEPGLYKMPSTTAQLNRILRIGQTTLAGLEQRCGGVADPDGQVAGRFTFVDCTGFKDLTGKKRLSYLSGLQRPNLLFQIWGLGAYILKQFTPVGRDCHSGYFDFPETLRFIFGSAGVGLPAMWPYLPDGSKPTLDWVKEHGFRVMPGDSWGQVS